MSVFNLRPHHALCISFFEGKGYSEDFTANMTRVINAFSEESASVRLTCSADVICAACPNACAGGCDSPDKVDSYDKAVLDICGLSEGGVIGAGELFALAREMVIDSGKIANVCADCCWAYICHGKI